MSSSYSSIVFILIISSCYLLAVTVNGEFHNKSMECHRKVLEELDEYLKENEMIHDNSKRRFPETFPELREACHINKRVTQMMHNLAEKCMSGFTKNIMMVSIYSIRRQRKSLCRSKPTKEIMEFLDAGKCVNGGRKVFSQCLHRTQAHILSVKHVEPRKRIPLICCEMVRAKQCLLDAAREVPQCTEKHLDVLQTRYMQASANSMNMACGDYTEDSDKCDYMLPPPNVDYENQPQSFMMAALELMELFENDPELQKIR